MFALVADAGIAFGFVLVIVLAGVVAVVGTICLVFKASYSVLCFVYGCIGRAFGGAGTKHDSGRAESDAGAPSLRCHPCASAGSVCTDARCGHENPPGAAYCGRCGQRLGTW